ncbi:GP88 family protein [Rhizobium leguminosarum]|uniref:GP88 family protein n=1 Tax=Rhizobium leguminosarum TaxID=384 RepID=UPI001609083A|nr:hypothetical protein [Rhizobium leguminosarum]MBB4345198.1 hypothetical protein [Rhizobium leguminosarum]MBB6298269.1 hypothetical protein [Rhizobium leguminosarum]
MFKGTLIRSGNNAKTVKGDGEYETAIMYLAPFTMAGANVCPMAEQAGCVKGCLNTAGRGAYNNVQQARIAKTKRYQASRTAFMADLVTDLERFVAYCKRKGVKPAVRLNGTSDIQWEVAHYASRGDARGSVFELFPEVQFYDYTKVYKRAYRQLPANYALTLSYSAANPAYAEVVTKAAHETGANLAIVYRTKEQRDYFVGKLVQYGDACRDVIDGDETDMRFLDPKGVIVGLYAKGKAKGDQSGFVVG